MEYTPRQRLEIRGAFSYVIAFSIVMFFATILQIVANAGAAAITLNLIITSMNVLIAVIIYRRKKRNLRATILPWIIGFTTTILPIAVKYNYAMSDGWTFAARSANTSAILVAFVILLAFFYNPRLFRFFSIYAIFNWSLFLFLAYRGGAQIHFSSHINGIGVITGLIFWAEAAFILFSGLGFIAIYRILSEVIRFDKKSTKQYVQIAHQAEAQNRLTAIIKEKTDLLFQKIDSQHTLLNSFNVNMEAQAARFSEISATMEEISGASEQMASDTGIKLLDGNMQVETVVDEFKDIRAETKRNLDETYHGIQFVSTRSAAANERLMDVEKTVNEIKDQSNRIGQIVELIVDIADRINLLSLNASIEAARAGESGRGFAVVADEIGKLAFQTQESIKEINAVISHSAKSTVEGAAVIQKTAEMMREMVGQVNQNANRIKILHESLSIEERFTKIIIEQMNNNIALAKRVTTGTEEQRIAFQSSFKALEELVMTLDGMVADAQNMTQISNEIYGGASEIITETTHFTANTKGNISDEEDE